MQNLRRKEGVYNFKHFGNIKSIPCILVIFLDYIFRKIIGLIIVKDILSFILDYTWMVPMPANRSINTSEIETIENKNVE